MAADLFETYAVTMIAAMLLASLLFKAQIAWVIYPLLLGAVSVVGSIAGTFFVRVFNPRWIMGALYAGLLVAAAGAIPGFFLVPPDLTSKAYLAPGGGAGHPPPPVSANPGRGGLPRPHPPHTPLHPPTLPRA